MTIERAMRMSSALHESRFLSAMSQSTLATTKYAAYAPVYDTILSDLAGRESLTILEIGVAEGGSLQTWRALFGSNSRIIGVEMNPDAVRLESLGFEIVIGDSGTPEFWQTIGEICPEGIDLIVDDGGHSNAQQIAALQHGRKVLTAHGWIVVEDIHASWMKSYGNPSRWSTWNFLLQLFLGHQLNHYATRRYRESLNSEWEFDLILLATSIVGMRKASDSFRADSRLDYGVRSENPPRDYRFESLARFTKSGPAFFKNWRRKAALHRQSSRAYRQAVSDLRQNRP